MTEEAGLRVVRRVRELFQVDPEWSAEMDRGFRWWAHRLCQRIWSTGPVEVDGLTLYRVHAATDVVQRVSLPRHRLAQDLSMLNFVADSSALVDNSTFDGSAPAGDGDGILVRAHSAVWVHDQIAPWIGDVFATLAIVQLTE